MEFKIDCNYCDPPKTLFKISLPPLADEMTWRRAWKSTLTGGINGGPQFTNMRCACGAEFTFEDDGISVEDGGLVKKKNVSRPKITGLTLSGGARDGGAVVTIVGAALDHGSISVKFDKNIAKIKERTSNSVTVEAPYGCYRLNVAEGPLRKLLITKIAGNLINNEAFTIGNTGITGSIRCINSDSIMVAAPSLSTEDWIRLVGETLQGSSSGASVRISASHVPVFISGEQLVGLLSNSSGVFRADPTSFIVDRPTNSFAPREPVVGLSSGAAIILEKSPAYSGAVDVSVENELGQRLDGSSRIKNGFTYF